MKIYGTVKSDRAMRGQGGNYLDIEIFNKNQQVVARIKATPEGDEKVKISFSLDQNLSKIVTEERNKKCECTDPLCAKCLLVDCEDAYCNVHPILKKLEFRKIYKKSK